MAAAMAWECLCSITNNKICDLGPFTDITRPKVSECVAKWKELDGIETSVVEKVCTASKGTAKFHLKCYQTFTDKNSIERALKQKDKGCLHKGRGRNNGMKIFVGDQICYSWPATREPPPIANVTCRRPLTGNTVTIRTPREYLTLCEVEIFVCSDGWFGDNCDKQCHCADVCDKITGRCPTCDDGLFGNQCQYKCGQCKSNLPCNKVSAICEDGCNPGFEEPYCVDECVDGMYGSICTSRCCHCKDYQFCNKINGVCADGCVNNYKAPLCQVEVERCDNASNLASQRTALGAALGVAVLIIVLAGSLYIVRLKMYKKALELERGTMSSTPIWIREQ